MISQSGPRSVSPRPALPLLVERDGELGAIDLAIAQAGAGKGVLVVIEGRPGAGKSALLEVARERAAARGIHVVRARGSTLERELGFGVARQLFERPLVRASPGERAELLAGAAAPAGPLVGVPPPCAEGSTGTPDGAFEALHGLFWLTANFAMRAPLLLVIDDLQWCDAASLRWLAYLVRRIEDLPLCIVVTNHADEPGAPVELLAETTAGARVLRPAPLGPGSVALMARDALAAEPDEAFCVTCHALTGGNPLLVCTLLAALAQEGVLPAAAERARVCEIGSRAVWRLVRLRLARLGPAPDALLRAVAILGDGAAIDHAARLAGVRPRKAIAAAAALTQTGLLRTDSVLSFAHPVEHAAIYSMIDPVQREAAHAQAAWLLAAEGACAEQVAAHLVHAPSHHVPFAVDVLTEAAQAVARRGAPRTAVAYLRRALHEPLTTGERIDALLGLSRAEQRVDRSAAARHMHQALTLIQNDEQRAQVGLRLSETLWHAAQPAEAVRAFEQAITALGAGRDELRGRLYADLLGLTMLVPGMHAVGERQLKEIEHTPAQDPVSERMLLATIAFRDAREGRGLGSCADRAEAAVADKTPVESRAYTYACRVLVAADRFETAAAAYDNALRRAEEHGAITLRAKYLALRAGLAIDRGALTDAETDARAALDAARAAGGGAVLPFSLTFLALALLEQGALEPSAAALEQIPYESTTVADLPCFPFALLVSAQLRRAEGDAAGALAATLQAAEGFTALGQRNPALAGWRSEAALGHLQLGDRDAARTIAAEEVSLARAWGAPRTLGRALRVAGLAEGGEAGIDMLRESHAVLMNSPARLEHAKTLIELGAAERRAGHRNQARTLLRHGLELADTCGAAPLTQHARHELRIAGARPRRTRITGPEALTPSEQRVAAMAIEGKTNREIAQALFVTPKTVEVHLSNTYRKLEISSRMQLAKALA